MTLTEWWRNHKVLPPFKIEVKEHHSEIEIEAVKIYPHCIWFLDGFSKEYFDGTRLNVKKAPFIVDKNAKKDFGLEF